MNIEYRFKVLRPDGSPPTFEAGEDLVIGKISGHRKHKVVTVTRTSALDYRSAIPLEQWDKMPQNERHAQAEYIGFLGRSIQRHEEQLKSRQRALADALSKTYPVKRMQ